VYRGLEATVAYATLIGTFYYYYYYYYWGCKFSRNLIFPEILHKVWKL